LYPQQEVSQRILEAVGAVAGSSLEQTSWLSRNLEVKAQPQVCPQGDEDDHDGNEFEGKHAENWLYCHHMKLIMPCCITYFETGAVLKWIIFMSLSLRVCWPG